MTEPRQPGAIDVNGELYLRDAKGNLVPLTAVKPVDLLVDELVRGIIQRAQVMSDALAQFRSDTFEQIRSLQGLLDQQYGATVWSPARRSRKTSSSFVALARQLRRPACATCFSPATCSR